MDRPDRTQQKYKESRKLNDRICHKVSEQDKYWTELILRAKSNNIVTRYNTTPGDKFTVRYPPDNHHRFARSKSEHDCSIANYEYYLRHNLYIKSAVETHNLLSFQMKKVSFRNYTPKILSQQVNMGMWI